MYLMYIFSNVSHTTMQELTRRNHQKKPVTDWAQDRTCSGNATMEAINRINSCAGLSKDVNDTLLPFFTNNYSNPNAEESFLRMVLEIRHHCHSCTQPRTCQTPKTEKMLLLVAWPEKSAKQMPLQFVFRSEQVRLTARGTVDFWAQQQQQPIKSNQASPLLFEHCVIEMQLN